MLEYKFDRDKAVNGLLLIAKALGGRVGRHMAFKIMYFADQKHLSKYGRPIFGDDYYSLPDGPVPTVTYDIVKKSNWNENSLFRTSGKYILPNGEVDFDEFSQSDLECLKESIDENKHLSFNALRDKSHQLAWNSAAKRGGASRIYFEDIAEEANVPDGMKAYISMVSENMR